MATTKKAVKHSKIKNAGLLFELLTRQLTADIISGNSKSKAHELIEKNFGNDTELGKEHRLYQALAKHKMIDSERATAFVNEVIEAHKKLHQPEIRKMKYNLIREIKDTYPLDSLFKSRIDNYKIYASIYKLFQAKSCNENIAPEDIVEAKFTIIENIIGKKDSVVIGNGEDDKLKEMISEYEKQNKDLRLLTYKILVERFNDKYSELNEPQKELIREYINNVSNVNSLESYVAGIIPSIVKELTEVSQTVNDKVMRIKVNEILNQLDLLKESKTIDDNQVVALLNMYELVKELKLIKDNGSVV